MPVNDRYPLPDVLALCRRHWERTNRRVFVEYVMLAGVNDSPAQGRLLARLLGREAFKVNLIPYNPTGMYDGSSRDAIAAFKAELVKGGVRRPSGSRAAATSPRPAGSSRRAARTHPRHLSE